MAKLKYHLTLHDASGPTIGRALEEYQERPGTSLRFMRGRTEPLELTFAEVYEGVYRRARRLRELGLNKGDRVAFVVPETDQFVLTFLAALVAGVVPVPMYPPLSFGKLDAYVQTAQKIIASSGARMLLTDKRMQKVLWSLVDKVPTLESLLTTDMVEVAPLADVELDEIEMQDVAFLQYTSGSTSDPKGVVVTHSSLMANLDAIMNVGLRISDDDVAVSWLPLYHDMGLIGLVLAPVWFGVPTTYIPTLDFVKHPACWMQAMSDYDGTVSFAPNFAYALATKRTKPEKVAAMKLSQVKALGCGAEPNHPETLRGFIEHFAPAGLREEALLPAYGMAEATLAMTFEELSDPLYTDVIDADEYEASGFARPIDLSTDSTVRVVEHVSCGRPFPGHEIVIVDEDLNPVQERHVGQIVFRGPSVTGGYYQDPERTLETFSDKGLLTGDMGYLADGNLYVTGRKKDLIILNGRNYDPQAVEWIVQDVEGVRKGNVVAFSVPGEDTEELVVVAEVKPEVDREAVAAEAARRVREQLFLNPADVLLVGRGELPKTSSGKLQRARTRRDYLDGALGEEGVRLAGTKGNRVTLAKHLARSAVSQVRHKVRRGATTMISRITPQ